MHNNHSNDDIGDNVVFDFVLIQRKKDHQNFLFELNANIASLA